MLFAVFLPSTTKLLKAPTGKSCFKVSSYIWFFLTLYYIKIKIHLEEDIFDWLIFWTINIIKMVTRIFSAKLIYKALWLFLELLQTSSGNQKYGMKNFDNPVWKNRQSDLIRLCLAKWAELVILWLQMPLP